MLLSELNINLHCTSTSLDVPAVQILWKSTQRFFEIPRRRFFTKNFKNLYQMHNFKFKKNLKTF